MCQSLFLLCNLSWRGDAGEPRKMESGSYKGLNRVYAVLLRQTRACPCWCEMSPVPNAATREEVSSTEIHIAVE